MHILVERQQSANSCTIGKLSIDGVFKCFTLEDQVRELPGVPVASWKISGQTAIPVGTYDATINFSQRFKKQLIRLLSVEGFEGILVHAGNKAVDTDGCLLVGMDKTGDSVGRSKIALDMLQPLVQAALDRGESVSITIAPFIALPSPAIAT
jgi:hypothetical protein